MLRRGLVGKGQDAVAQAAAAGFHRVRMRTGGGEVFCLGMVADAERGHVFLVLVEFVVEIRPVAAFGGGDAARAARAHAVVEVAVVFGVNGGAGGDARQYFGGRGFIASVAQAEAARRCGQRGDDGKGAVLVGDNAARERGGEVGAAAALLYGKDGAVGSAVQGEQVTAAEEPRPRVGSMSLSMAISRPLAGGFCRSAAMRKRNWGWSARVARSV